MFVNSFGSLKTIFSSIPGLFSIFIFLKVAILFITSLTSLSGVEAPEEIPIESTLSNQELSKSSAVSIRYVSTPDSSPKSLNLFEF